MNNGGFLSHLFSMSEFPTSSHFPHTIMSVICPKPVIKMREVLKNQTTCVNCEKVHVTFL